MLGYAEIAEGSYVMSCPSNRQIPLPKIVSLFSGAGGLDYGFAREGFEVAVAFDISSAAIKTHRRNFPLTLGIAGDLTKLKPSGVLKHVLGTIPERRTYRSYWWTAVPGIFARQHGSNRGRSTK